MTIKHVINIKMSTPMYSFQNRNPRKQATFSEDNSHDYLYHFLMQSGHFTENDLSDLDQFWDINSIKKNTVFYKNQPAGYFNIILKGAVKLCVDQKDITQITGLLTEGNYWTTQKDDAGAAFTGHVVKDTVLAGIGTDTILKLSEERPVFLKYFLEMYDNELLLLRSRITALLVLPAGERYEALYKNYPAIVSEFNLGDVANYLGMKAETLSRVRQPGNKNT